MDRTPAYITAMFYNLIRFLSSQHDSITKLFKTSTAKSTYDVDNCITNPEQLGSTNCISRLECL